MSGRRRLAGAACAGLLLAGALHAADHVDEGLLEFLGSVDAAGGDWHEYLAAHDVDAVARRAAQRERGATKAPPPAPPQVTPGAAGQGKQS